MIVDDAEKFNEFFYQIMDDMVDIAEEKYTTLKVDISEKVKKFCWKFRKAINGMDKKETFDKNLIDFVSTLDPEEENILFYSVATYFYEAGKEKLSNVELPQEDRIPYFASVVAAEGIVRILDNFLGFAYFDEDDDFE